MKGCFIKIAEVLEYISFVTLLVTTFYFVYGIIQEYLEGVTGFHNSKQTITRDDLPTITICFLASSKFVLGKDYTLEVTSNWPENSTLYFK